MASWRTAWCSLRWPGCRPEADALTQRLGKVLCPLLLALIGALFVGCLLAPHPYGAAAEAYQTHPVIQGFLDGYQTMDAIAALVFGSVIALNLRALGLTEARAIGTEAALDGVGAGVLLGVVYLCLAHIGGVSGGAWPGAKNGAQVLSQLAGSVYGRGGMALLAAIFVVACPEHLRGAAFQLRQLLSPAAAQSFLPGLGGPVRAHQRGHLQRGAEPDSGPVGAGAEPAVPHRAGADSAGLPAKDGNPAPAVPHCGLGHAGGQRGAAGRPRPGCCPPPSPMGCGSFPCMHRA